MGTEWGEGSWFTNSHSFWGISGRGLQERPLQGSPSDPILFRAATSPGCRHQPGFGLLSVCCHLLQVGLCLKGWSWAGRAAGLWIQNQSMCKQWQMGSLAPSSPLPAAARDAVVPSCPERRCALWVLWRCTWSCVCSEQDCIRVKAKKLTFRFPLFFEIFWSYQLAGKNQQR